MSSALLSVDTKSFVASAPRKPWCWFTRVHPASGQRSFLAKQGDRGPGGPGQGIRPRVADRPASDHAADLHRSSILEDPPAMLPHVRPAERPERSVSRTKKPTNLSSKRTKSTRGQDAPGGAVRDDVPGRNLRREEEGPPRKRQAPAPRRKKEVLEQFRARANHADGFQAGFLPSKAVLP